MKNTKHNPVIIGLSQHYEYKGYRTNFLFIPKVFLWIGVLIYKGESYVTSYCSVPKFKKLMLGKKDKLESYYSPGELKFIIERLKMMSEATVDYHESPESVEDNKTNDETRNKTGK